MLMLLMTLAGCASAGGDPPPAFDVDRRLVLVDPDAGVVEHPAHAALLGDPALRLLPEQSADARRFAVLDTDHVILRKGPIDDPGRGDNLSELVAGEELWLLDRAAGDHDGRAAWLVHSSDGYLGYVDEADLAFVDAAEFDRRLQSRTSPEAAEKVERAVAHAESLLGTPYLWGGKTAAGIDCSGLTQTCYAAAGVRLPRDSDQQADVGRLAATRWHRGGLVRGDLLFFLSPRRGRISHVAMYLGDGRLIESKGRGVQHASLDPAADDYIGDDRLAHLAWARRVVE